MEIGDSKMIVKQNMLFLVDNMNELSNFVMFNWMKNDDLKLDIHWLSSRLKRQNVVVLSKKLKDNR